MIIPGKNALITGGAIRVGREITLGLARAGANVAINYFRDAEMAAETAEEARSLGVRAFPVRADIGDWNQVQGMFAEIHRELGPVDILVNNASIFKKTPIPSTSVEDWHAVTRLLIDGAFYVSKLAAVDMLERKEGVIINIVDLSIWYAWPDFTAHAVGKSALMALTRQLAMDLAPYVRANAIAPGPILAPEDYSEEKKEMIARRTLLDRWGSPKDISKTVNFLVESDYITAEVIAVDGGERLGHRRKRV